MFCPNCGSQNNFDSKFCVGCGNPLSAQAMGGMIRNREEAEYYIAEIPKILPPLKAIANYDTQVYIINDYIINEKRKRPIKAYLITFLVWAALFGLLFFMTYLNGGRNVMEYFSLALVSLAVVSPAIVIYIGYFFIRLAKIDSYKKQIKGIEGTRDRIIVGISDAVTILPQNYRYYIAASIIYKDFINGKADTMKEAVRFCDEEIARIKSEVYAKESLELQRQINSKVNRIAKDVSVIKKDTKSIKSDVRFMKYF